MNLPNPEPSHIRSESPVGATAARRSCQTKPEASGQTDRNRPGRGGEGEEERRRIGGGFLPCVIVTVARRPDVVRTCDILSSTAGAWNMLELG